MILLCTYPLTTSPGAQIFDAARIHQVAVARRSGTWEIVETPSLDQALAKPLRPTAAKPFTFVQLSDSHIGFNKPPNADARATFREAVAKVKALPVQPDLLIHTGDVSQLSRDEEFDDADQILKELALPVFFIPGEHDMLDPDGGKAFLERFGKGSKGAGWYSFDHKGVHFVALVNVADLKPGGMGNLGSDQLKWLTSDLAGVHLQLPLLSSRIFRCGRSMPIGVGHR